MTRVAIVGSPRFPNRSLVKAYVRALRPGTVVVTDNADGVAAWVRRAATVRDLEVVVHGDPLDVPGDCDRLVSFWDGESQPAGDVIRRAEKAGLRVELCLIRRTSQYMTGQEFLDSVAEDHPELAEAAARYLEALHHQEEDDGGLPKR